LEEDNMQTQKTYSFAQGEKAKSTTTGHAIERATAERATERVHSEGLRPVKSFRSGAINVSIWENETINAEGVPTSYKTVSFDRRYKDKNGEWKSTNSLRANDLPKAVLILQKAYEYLVLTESEEE
jgi:hypothetical protein